MVPSGQASLHSGSEASSGQHVRQRACPADCLPGRWCPISLLISSAPPPAADAARDPRNRSPMALSHLTAIASSVSTAPAPASSCPNSQTATRSLTRSRKLSFLGVCAASRSSSLIPMLGQVIWVIGGLRTQPGFLIGSLSPGPTSPNGDRFSDRVRGEWAENWAQASSRRTLAEADPQRSHAASGTQSGASGSKIEVSRKAAAV